MSSEKKKKNSVIAPNAVKSGQRDLFGPLRERLIKKLKETIFGGRSRLTPSKQREANRLISCAVTKFLKKTKKINKQSLNALEKSVVEELYSRGRRSKKSTLGRAGREAVSSNVTPQSTSSSSPTDEVKNEEVEVTSEDIVRSRQNSGKIMNGTDAKVAQLQERLSQLRALEAKSTSPKSQRTAQGTGSAKNFKIGSGSKGRRVSSSKIVGKEWNFIHALREEEHELKLEEEARKVEEGKHKIRDMLHVQMEKCVSKRKAIKKKEQEYATLVREEVKQFQIEEVKRSFLRHSLTHSLTHPPTLPPPHTHRNKNKKKLLRNRNRLQRFFNLKSTSVRRREPWNESRNENVR